MRVAILMTDNRSLPGAAPSDRPIFGTAPTALLEGFAGLGAPEIHVVSCVRDAVETPIRIAPNILYHAVRIPRALWGRTLFLGCAAAVRRTLRAIDPDLVHGQGTERDCAVAAVLSGRPSVVTLHGLMTEIAEFTGAGLFDYYGVVSRLERACLRRTRAVVCISSSVDAFAAEFNANRTLIPNALRSSFFEESPRTAVGENVFLSVGEVRHRKNQIGLIRAFDTLPPADRPNLQFAGNLEPGTEYGRAFAQLVAERPWCSYLGTLSAEQLIERMRTARAFIHPALIEPFGLVVAEAMAVGLPVLAADRGGLKDIVADGVTGRLFDPEDSNAIASSVRDILDRPEESRMMASTAARQMRERYHPEVVARRTLELYEQILGGSSAASRADRFR